MSKEFIFNQTSIPGQFSVNMIEKYKMNWADTNTATIFRVMFTSIADILKSKQDKNVPRTGFSMKDDKGNFKLGAIMTYRKPDAEEEEDSGNWYLEMTFDPEDMVDIDKEIDNHTSEFTVVANDEAFRIAGARFNQVKYIHIIFGCIVDTIIDFLDANASESEDVSVTLNGVFTASVAIENGIKVMSIVPGGIIKQIIKEDSIL